MQGIPIYTWPSFPDAHMSHNHGKVVQTKDLTAIQYHELNYVDFTCSSPNVHSLLQDSTSHAVTRSPGSSAVHNSFCPLAFHHLNTSKEHSGQALCRSFFNLFFLMLSPNDTGVIWVWERNMTEWLPFWMHHFRGCPEQAQPTTDGLDCIFIIVSLVYFIHVFLQFFSNFFHKRKKSDIFI